MEFLNEYGLFLAKALTVIVGVLLAVAGVLALTTKEKIKGKGQLEVTQLNKRFKSYIDILLRAMHDKKTAKRLKKAAKLKQEKVKDTSKERIFVLRFDGDIRASSVDALREEITALLLLATPKDKVLLCLESGGGLVNAYGLAASQLARIKEANIELTVAVDKVAASGGYMMACVADRILAAPFAIIGSIGVLAQLPNFHRFLKSKAIDFEQIQAGQYKRTLTVFGENTETGREKMQEEVNETHELFKDFIQTHRRQVNVANVATGEHWYGSRALELKLVDQLETSDDFLLRNSQDKDLYEIRFRIKKSLPQRLGSSMTNLWHQLIGY